MKPQEIKKTLKTSLKEQQKTSRQATAQYKQKLKEEEERRKAIVPVYVADTVKFPGYIQTKMSDGEHSDYTGMTLEQIREHENNPNLNIVTLEELLLLNEQYENSLCKPFSEITEEQYWDWLECVPPKRHKRNSFFVGECYTGTLYEFCFEYNKHYFSALRNIKLSDQELEEQIQEYIREHQTYLMVATRLTAVYKPAKKRLKVFNNGKQVLSVQVEEEQDYWNSIQIDEKQYDINLYEWGDEEEENILKIALYPVVNNQTDVSRFASLALEIQN